MQSIKSGYIDRYDYRVDIHRRRNIVTASTFVGDILANSNRVILVDEQNHGLVFYFPRDSVDMARLELIADRSSTCPYKGDASYWQLVDDPGEPVAWTYETPLMEVAQLAGHVAFYQNRIVVSVGIAENLHFGG